MIIFVNNDFHTYTHEDLKSVSKLPKLKIISYSSLLRQKNFARGTYVFTDRERMDQWELRIYSKLYAHLKNSGTGYRVLNNPAKTMNRLELLRMLYRENINDFNVYMVSERQRPERYPVFIRRAFDHRSPLTSLLDNEAELDRALSKLKAQQEPDEGLVIIEYCAEPLFENLFRKTSVYRIGDNIIIGLGAHERNWVVKRGELNAATDAIYSKEFEMIKNNENLDEIHLDEIRHIFELANIDYGRMDYGVVKGKMQVYEINTNPTIRPPNKEHPNPNRTKSQDLVFEKLCQAFNAIDSTDLEAPLAKQFKHRYLVKSFLNRLKYKSAFKRW